MEVVYNGNIIYEDPTGSDFTLLTSEGKVSVTGTENTYEYYLKDHLGNNRVMFHEDGTGSIIVDQVNNYYPFGMLFEKQNLDRNKFLYNGKELQEDVFGDVALDWYDYGARFYDPALGRWHVVDPLAEEEYSWTPFRYGFNNPLKFVDPNGMLEWIPEADEEGNVSYTAEEGDGAHTLSEQYGIDQDQAEEITGTKGEETVEKGTKISGEKVEEVTGSEILKMDWQSEKATDSRRIDHILFAMEKSAAEGTYTFKTQDYFKNIPYLHNGERYGYGGAAFLKGYTTKITGQRLYVQMMFNHRNTWPIDIIPSSKDNWYVPHQKMYYFRYTALSNKGHPTMPMLIKFKGRDNMLKFTNKFEFEFSEITR